MQSACKDGMGGQSPQFCALFSVITCEVLHTPYMSTASGFPLGRMRCVE